MVKVGGGRQYLVIDLAAEQWEVRLIPVPTFTTYLGGEALGLHLWSLHVSDTSGTLNDEPICFTLGALAGSSMPCSSTITIVGRSPATHLVETSTRISHLSDSMASCGWQAIVLHGVARRQMTLHITSDSVEFRPSDKLIGKTTGETSSHLKAERLSAVLSIGPAGEHEVPYATLVHEGRALDRFGFGATLGMKHIKALVVVDGSMKYAPSEKTHFDQTCEQIQHVLGKSRYVSDYVQDGPLGLLETARKKGFAAIDNMSKRTDPRLFHLEGPECSRKFALEVSSCDECIVCCNRNVMRPGGNDTVLPDTLEMMALGSNIGNYDPALVMQLRSQCVELGLDPISTGMVIGWASSVDSAGLLEDGLGLEQDGSAFMRLIESIARRSSQGLLLSEGTLKAMQALGDARALQSYDCQVFGREMAPFDPRGAWGQALLSGLREDFPLIPELVLQRIPAASLHAKAAWVVLQENHLAMIRSVGLCADLMLPLLYEGGGSRLKYLLLKYGSRFPSKMKRLMGVRVFAELVTGFTGYRMTEDQILDVGRRAVMLKRSINGSDAYPAKIPERFLIDPESNHGEAVTIPYTKLVEQYRLMRALDSAELEE